MAVIEKRPTAYRDNKRHYNEGSESLSSSDWWLGEKFLALSHEHFLQIHLANAGITAAPCLSSPKRGAHIQISQPLALSGLYPRIQSFHKLANFQHFMLASG